MNSLNIIINASNLRVLYDNPEELETILKDAVENPSKYEKMSEKARNYYLNNASPENMARGVLDAINYALNH